MIVNSWRKLLDHLENEFPEIEVKAEENTTKLVYMMKKFPECVDSSGRDVKKRMMDHNKAREPSADDEIIVAVTAKRENKDSEENKKTS